MQEFRADIGLQGLIYLLFLIVWVVGQVISKARAGRDPGRPPVGGNAPTPPPRPRMNPEVRELLETLTGQRFEPPLPEAPPPRRHASPPTPRAKRLRPPPPVVVPAAPPPTPWLPEPAEPMQVLPPVASSQHMALGALRIPTINMQTPRMRMPSMPSTLSRLAPAAHPLDVRAMLHGKTNLRHQMIGRIALGPARGLTACPDLMQQRDGS